jgi:hypothetical protein
MTFYFNPILAWCQWLLHVILATQEVEVRRVLARNQPQDPISKIPNPKTELAEWLKV